MNGSRVGNMKNAKGYTLLELLVIVIVIGIVMAVGVPQISTFFEGNRMVSNTNALVAALNIARSEAIKRGNRVTVCKSSNADAGTPSCDNGADWEDGWIVFEDTDGNIGDYNSGSDGALLYRQAGVEGDQTTVRTNDADIMNYVSFTSRGTPQTANGRAQSGMFRICDDRGLTNAAGNVVARGVVLSAAGKVRLTKDGAVIGGCP